MNFEWTTQERHSGEKNPEWYLAVSVIAITIVVTSIIFNNVLLAIIIAIGFFTLIMNHRKGPRDIHAVVNATGVRIDDYVYTYDNLESFFVNEDKHQLILKSTKLLSPHIVVPLGESVDLGLLEKFLLDHLDQEEMHESIFEQFMEYLGF